MTSPNSPALNPTPLADPGVSTLLSGLQMDNPDRDQTILRHSHSIAVLETQACRNEEVIKKQAKDIKSLTVSLQLASDSSRSTTQQELLQMRNSFDFLNNTLNSRLAHLEGLGSRAVVVPEPPFHSHIFFTGSMREVYRFCSDMRDIFARLPGHFSGEKHKILYIASYFRASKDNSVDECNSTVWWRGLLAENAGLLGLDTRQASLLSDFVHPSLLNSEAFLGAIVREWPNVNEHEEDWRAFESLHQGKTSIGDFNSAFNTLYHRLGIPLDPRVLCDYYDKAVCPDIVKLGAVRGGWTGLNNLKDKQALAVTFSLDPMGISIVNQMVHPKAQMVHPKAPLPNRPFQSAQGFRPPAPIIRPPVAKLSPGVPMELDAMSGGVYSWPLFVEVCKEHAICIRCGGDWDTFHKTSRVCPVPLNSRMTEENIQALWVEWGGILDTPAAGVSKWSPEHRANRASAAPAPSVRSSATPSSMNPFAKGKKRESISNSSTHQNNKRRVESSVDEISPVASTSGPVVESGPYPLGDDSVSMDPLSMAEVYLSRQIMDEDIQD
ncbi:hypothetical protein PSTT_04050 [Puccinia striiformis]|uniref:Retrotransposon gag domain-containing protein n=1 Tax=Puccinia striiformis TaxID=27350 RepID=A0A2S4VU53_9BASI|nr:hypothetical protein PSTT_04050 [Puccinia striiformis]